MSLRSLRGVCLARQVRLRASLPEGSCWTDLRSGDTGLSKIRSHQSCLALVNHPGIAPPTCISHMIAIRLLDVCAIYAPPPRLSLRMPYTIQFGQRQCRVKAKWRGGTRSKVSMCLRVVGV